MAEVRPVHLNPSAELAERVLLPGDPKRALAVAQDLLTAPLMFNHRRGLWGYTGVAPDGGPLTVQATGIGGPSAAIVAEELVALGARRLVRIGTCGALGPGLTLGELVAVEAALVADGASAALGAGERARGDAELTAALERAGARRVVAATTDLFWEPRAEVADGWRERGAAVVEMEAATILTVAARRGVAAACALAVTDQNGRRLDDAAIEAVGPRLGRLGYAAVAEAAG